jgi:hypothetical protein
MLHVTENAKTVLLEKKRLANIDQPDVGFRLATSTAGDLGLVADKPKAGDEVVKRGEVVVLMADPAVSAFVLAGRTLDCRQNAEGKMELVLRRGARG